MATVSEATKEAGGGQLEHGQSVAKVFTKRIKDHVDRVYEELLREYNTPLDIYHNVQKADESEFASFLDDDSQHTGVNSFMSYLASPHASIIGHQADEDLSHPLSHYFISSSHNTYLTGNQLSSEASADGYRNVLLRGCRCVEIDVWDGKPLEDTSYASSADARAGATASDVERQGLRDRFRAKLKFGKSKQSSNSQKEGKPAASTQPKSTKPELKTPDFLQVPELKSTAGKAEPRVLHGYTLTKEVSFREVCEAIRDTAFVTSDLPVIISLEVHAGLEQQELMVQIMESTWAGMLIEDVDHCIDKLPTPDHLRRKILIKVKYTPPEQAVEEQKAEEKGTNRPPSSSSSSDTEQQGEKEKPKKKKKMLESLSRLGVYTRAHHFSSWDQPEAKEPTHVFSLSEGAVTESLETHAAVMFKHNKKFLMRTYPKGTRFTSSNLTPTPFWRQGVHMVALNWQKWDKGTMINDAMFANTGGWVLKPEQYRVEGSSHATATSVVASRGRELSDAAASTDGPARRTNSNASLSPESAHTSRQNTLNNAQLDSVSELHQAHHTNTRILDLTIEIFAGQSLPLPPEEDTERSFRPYIKVSLHTETLSSPLLHRQSGLRRTLSRNRSIRNRTHSSTSVTSADASGAPVGVVAQNDGDGSSSARDKSPKPYALPTKTSLMQRTHTGRLRDPDFLGQKLVFEGIPIDEERLCFLRFKVEDDVQFQRDPMAAWACIRLDRVREGIRTVQLLDCGGKACEGLLVVRVTKVWKDAAVVGMAAVGSSAANT